MRALFRPGPATAGGERFTLCHEPVGSPRALIIAVPAFAEELNKSRRMMSLAGRALAQCGFAVVMTDLFGTGDSSGELEDATWSDWLDDVTEGVAWARRTYGDLPVVLWGVRAGCLLAVQAAERLQDGTQLLFWQPQINGRLALQQFLRLKMAGMIQDGPVKGVTEGLVRDLDAGHVVEVAGYRLGPGIARGLAAAQIGQPPRRVPASVTWLEVMAQVPASLMPASAAAVERWRSAGCVIDADAVPGPLFWQTLWIEDAPALVVRTTQALDQAFAAVPA